MLRVPDPKRVTGRRVLVFDDVFTEGSTLNEVAELCASPARGTRGVRRQPLPPAVASRRQRHDGGCGRLSRLIGRRQIPGHRTWYNRRPPWMHTQP